VPEALAGAASSHGGAVPDEPSRGGCPPPSRPGAAPNRCAGAPRSSRSWSLSLSSLGLRCGREERSCRQARLSCSSLLAARQRETQVWAVDLVKPSSSTSATKRRRPFGVSGALRCCIRVLLEVVGVEHPQPLGGPGSTSWRSERGEARHLGPREKANGPGQAGRLRRERSLVGLILATDLRRWVNISISATGLHRRRSRKLRLLTCENPVKAGISFDRPPS
jgi:hypothetical protein